MLDVDTFDELSEITSNAIDEYSRYYGFDPTDSVGEYEADKGQHVELLGSGGSLPDNDKLHCEAERSTCNGCRYRKTSQRPMDRSGQSSRDCSRAELEVSRWCADVWDSSRQEAGDVSGEAPF